MSVTPLVSLSVTCNDVPFKQAQTSSWSSSWRTRVLGRERCLSHMFTIILGCPGISWDSLRVTWDLWGPHLGSTTFPQPMPAQM